LPALSHLAAQEIWNHNAIKSNKNGIELITIWEIDWNKNKEQIKQDLLCKLK